MKVEKKVENCLYYLQFITTVTSVESQQ